MLPARIPVLLVGLLAAQLASASVEALLACRQLPPGQERADCLERESGVLERERQAATAATPAAAPRRKATGSGPANSPRAASSSAGLAVISIEYVEGRPLFTLDNGERWQAREERQLTAHPGADVVSFERSPAGTVLRFNGSFFGLHVAQVR